MRWKVIDNFKTDLVLRAAQMPSVEILRAMGYQKPTFANLERLKSVVDDPEFGLDAAGFDFKFSSEDFLRKLCSVVGIDHAVTEKRMKSLMQYIGEENSAFKPFIWVNTGFTRKSQPLFALAACEEQRYLSFSKGFWRRPVSKQLCLAQCRIREHFYETGGELGIWGEIKQYWFYYEKDAAYLLARNGDLMGKRGGPVPDQAIGSKELAIITRTTREAQ